MLHVPERVKLLGRGVPVAYEVERVALKLSPDRSDPGSIPARGPVLHVLPSTSHIFMSISLYNRALKSPKRTQDTYIITPRCVWMCGAPSSHRSMLMAASKRKLLGQVCITPECVWPNGAPSGMLHKETMQMCKLQTQCLVPLNLVPLLVFLERGKKRERGRDISPHVIILRACKVITQGMLSVPQVLLVRSRQHPRVIH